MSETKTTSRLEEIQKAKLAAPIDKKIIAQHDKVVNAEAAVETYKEALKNLVNNSQEKADLDGAKAMLKLAVEDFYDVMDEFREEKGQMRIAFKKEGVKAI